MELDSTVFGVFQTATGIRDKRMGKRVLAHVTKLRTTSFDMNLAMMNANKNANEKVQVQRNQRFNVTTVAIRRTLD